MVMVYEAGESLHQYLRRVAMPHETTVKNILMPILDGLQAVHKIGFMHRDIKPSNVFIRENGIPLLLDFGSARVVTGKISKSMTAIVSPGYAPLEQYSNEGNQGPWSDIYALSAVIYRVVTGENPPDAIKRMKADTVPQALSAARAQYSERFLKAIEWGMTLDEKMRPQRVADWRDLFLGRAPMTALSRGASMNTPTSTATPQPLPSPLRRAGARGTSRSGRPRAANSVMSPLNKRKWIIAGGIVLFVVLLAVIVWEHRSAAVMKQPQAVNTTTR
jgi:serine/threonine protein kinase